MITYKYCVHDDEGQIKDACFDDFGQAYDYAQNGLVTFIEEIPYIDGVEDEENTEIVWAWDDTHSRDKAINYVCSRHNDCEPVEEELELEVKADTPEELAEFARCILGDDFETFDQDFDEVVPDAEIKLEPKEIAEPIEESVDIDSVNIDLSIPGFNFEIVDSFNDGGYKGYNVVYSKDGTDLVEVEVWEDDSPVAVVDNLYSRNLFNPVYDSFESFVADLDYKASKYLREALNDNAVKDCKNYKLVAHCKEEKPVCNIEKPVLPDELTDPELDMTDEEFYEAFGKALKNKIENK